MIEYVVQDEPQMMQLTQLFENSFARLLEEDEKEFRDADHQDLIEWFDILSMEYYLLQGNAVLIEAKDGKKVVGAVCIGKQSPIFWPDGQKIEVIILAVDPEYRQQGIARELMTRAEQEAKGMGGKSIIVNTHHSLEKVQEMYKKLGYKKIGTLNNYYDNGDAVFLMKKL